jgi:hypothetical protein
MRYPWNDTPQAPTITSGGTGEAWLARLDQSETVRAFDARARLEKLDPLLALAYRVEASGDRRADVNVSADSLLTGLRDAARRALKAAGHPERAPDELYPNGRRI